MLTLEQEGDQGVTALSFSPNGKAYSIADNLLRVWTTQTHFLSILHSNPTVQHRITIPETKQSEIIIIIPFFQHETCRDRLDRTFIAIELVGSSEDRMARREDSSTGSTVGVPHVAIIFFCLRMGGVMTRPSQDKTRGYEEENEGFTCKIIVSVL